MLIDVPGCSLPSNLLLVSITRTSSSSASFHRPPKLYARPTMLMLLRIFSSLRCRIFFLTSITTWDIKTALLLLPFLHAYHAALWSSETHSLSEPSAFGRYVIAAFAWGKSAWRWLQFSCSPIGNAADRLLMQHCFHCSRWPLASNQVRIASCTNACIAKVWSVSTEVNE